MMSSARAVAVTVVLLLGACRDAPTPTQPALGRPMHAVLGAVEAAQQVVAGQYIVVFRDIVADPVGLAGSLVNAQGGTLLRTYTRALKGFAARLPDAAVAVVRQNPFVAYVEPDHWSSVRSEEHTSELQSQSKLVCRLLLEKKKKMIVLPSAIYVLYCQEREHSCA